MGKYEFRGGNLNEGAKCLSSTNLGFSSKFSRKTSIFSSLAEYPKLSLVWGAQKTQPFVSAFDWRSFWFHSVFVVDRHYKTKISYFYKRILNQLWFPLLSPCGACSSRHEEPKSVFFMVTNFFKKSKFSPLAPSALADVIGASQTQKVSSLAPSTLTKNCGSHYCDLVVEARVDMRSQNLCFLWLLSSKSQNFLRSRLRRSRM